MSRAGFTFVEVIQAIIVVTVGVVGTYQLIGALYEQLAPNGPWGGLRRHIRGEELLRAQCEGLRALRSISPVAASNVVVVPDAASGYEVELLMSREPVVRLHGDDGRASGQQYFFADVSVRHRGQRLGTLSMSTLRTLQLDQPEKIGL